MKVRDEGLCRRGEPAMERKGEWLGGGGGGRGCRSCRYGWCGWNVETILRLGGVRCCSGSGGGCGGGWSDVCLVEGRRSEGGGGWADVKAGMAGFSGVEAGVVREGVSVLGVVVDGVEVEGVK